MTENNNPQELPAIIRGKVLVVDDETELTAALCEMLTKQGYETKGYNNGWEALDALKTQSFDVLLADLMMPEMDGITLLKSALEIDPQLVGLIMTGQGTVQTAVEAMKSGAFDYILKPFKLNSILSALSRTLEVRRLRMENVQLKEMVNIYELGQVVAFTLDIDVIFQKTAEAAMQQVQADEVSILLPDKHERDLILVSAFGDSREHLVGKKIPTEGTIAGWVASHHEMLTLQGEVNDIRFAPAHPRNDIRAAISMPMVLGNKLVGVINMNMIRQEHPLTEGQIQGLSILVGIAASALENARLYDQTEKRLQRLSALRTIDLAITSTLDLRVILNIFLEQVATQLKVDAAAILTFNAPSQTLEYAAGRGFRTDVLETSPIFLGVGYAGTAALDRRTIQVLDLQNAEPDPNRERLVTEEDFQTCFSTPLITKGEIKGVLTVFHRSSFRPDSEWVEFLEALAGQAAIAIESMSLFENLQWTNQQLLLAYNATIEGWSRALDLRDKETEGHTRRVTELAMKLAESIGGLSEEDLLQIRRGALLHDIGKMGVPDSILLKPGDLDQIEETIMRKHPDYAFELLSPIPYLRKALDIPHYHHERWDGTGYPDGLKEEQIPLAARIFSVVDVWDALRSDRPYRAGWPEDRVIQYIQEKSGIYFDPTIVDAFLNLLQSQGKSIQSG